MENKTNNYVRWSVFAWIIGTYITLSMVAYGYLFTVSFDAIDRARNNEVSISRLETQLTGIADTLKEIKDIIRDF